MAYLSFAILCRHVSNTHALCCMAPQKFHYKGKCTKLQKGLGLKYKMQFNKTVSSGTNIARKKTKEQKLLTRAIKSQKKQLSSKQDFPEY